MLKFCATAVAIETIDDVFVVILAERADGSGRRLELQLGSASTEQERALGMDTNCIVLESGATTYGGVSEWSLNDARLAMWLETSAETELGIDEGIVVDLPVGDAARVREAVKTILGSAPRGR